MWAASVAGQIAARLSHRAAAIAKTLRLFALLYVCFCVFLHQHTCAGAARSGDVSLADDSLV